MRHSVEEIHTAGGKVTGVTVRDRQGNTRIEPADEVVANVTAQNLVKLTPDKAFDNYQRRLDKLPQPSGAFVVYLGVKRAAIPADCSPHLQFLYDRDEVIGENNSLFVSVSKPEDGRAPALRARDLKFAPQKIAKARVFSFSQG